MSDVPSILAIDQGTTSTKAYASVDGGPATLVGTRRHRQIRPNPGWVEHDPVEIANHVLEHVSDVPRALSEIRRVLKLGGVAILQTPYSGKLHHTWEDKGIDTPVARLQAYGQEDHVRLFGRDIFEQITAAGFESRVHRHSELLADVDSFTMGVNGDEPFFLFRKI